MSLLETITKETIRSVLDDVLSDVRTSELSTGDDAGRLEDVFIAAITAEVSRISADRPLVNWTVKMTASVVEVAVTNALVDWNLRRTELLRLFVDPAIVVVANRQGYYNMSRVASKIGGSDFQEPGCCSVRSFHLIKTMRRDILAALDRPPCLSDQARHSTAEALAWIAIRDNRRTMGCGCG
jgi:hypothetical protein